MNTILNMQMLFSRAKIMTVSVNLEEVLFRNKYTKSFSRTTNRMNVIFVTSKRDVNKIKDLTKEPSFYGLVNLVLFVKSFETPSINFCMNPVGNPFLLSEGVTFFVKCYEDIRIQQWYAVNKNQLTIYDRTTWEPTSGLLFKSQKFVQSDKDILNGKVLRIGRIPVRYVIS